ncbi:helix-turn-helix domain-containing protein [Bacteroidota bacterium]
MSNLELKFIREKSGLTKEKFCDRLNISIHTLSSWESGRRNIPKVKALLIKELFNQEEVSQNKEESKKVSQKKEIAINEKEKKVPYYDLDVTSHITTSFSDVVEEPAFYVDYKPFNDCTAYVNNYGDSMFPKYKNGERLAVKQITNFDVLSWGETYLVITNGNANDLKTVKDVHPHEDFDKIILRASNPSYKGDTPVNKEDIISMFAVKGKISQNFI